MKFLSLLLYVVVFLPVWAVIRLTGATRFGRRFHQRASTWDRPVGAPRTTPTPDPARLATRGSNQ